MLYPSGLAGGKGPAHWLILAPASVCRQWQLELREKFNLNWPIYDGDKLVWLQTPGRSNSLEQSVSRTNWHKQPFIIASSHLMRRRERIPQNSPNKPSRGTSSSSTKRTTPSRKSPGLAGERRPNRLLELLHRIKGQDAGAFAVDGDAHAGTSGRSFGYLLFFFFFFIYFHNSEVP